MNNNQILLPVAIPLGSPDADALLPAFFAARKMELVHASVVNGAGVAIDAADFFHLDLKNGSDIVASISTETGDADAKALTADVAAGMNINSDNAEIEEGSTLTVEYNETDTGTAVALTDAMMILYFEVIQTAGGISEAA